MKSEEQSIQLLQDQLEAALKVIDMLQKQINAINISYAILERSMNQPSKVIKS